MLHKLRTALSLPPQEWLLFWRAWWLLLAVDLGLRLLPFRRLQSWLGTAAAASPGTGPPAAARSAAAASHPPAETERLIRQTQAAVERAIRNHLYPMTCLRRALALQRLLARQGIAAALRFGVQRQADGITAHAWLEYNGQPLGETQAVERRYAALAFQESAR